jgi:hypothetical protein
MGACGDAPVLLVNNKRMCSFMTADKLDALLDELDQGLKWAQDRMHPAGGDGFGDHHLRSGGSPTTYEARRLCGAEARSSPRRSRPSRSSPSSRSRRCAAAAARASRPA